MRMRSLCSLELMLFLLLLRLPLALFCLMRSLPRNRDRAFPRLSVASFAALPPVANPVVLQRARLLTVLARPRSPASAYGQKDGLAGAMKVYNPMAALAKGPMLDGGQKLVGWVGYHVVKARTNVPHYLPH